MRKSKAHMLSHTDKNPVAMKAQSEQEKVHIKLICSCLTNCSGHYYKHELENELNWEKNHVNITTNEDFKMFGAVKNMYALLELPGSYFFGNKL